MRVVTNPPTPPPAAGVRRGYVKSRPCVGWMRHEGGKWLRAWANEGGKRDGNTRWVVMCCEEQGDVLGWAPTDERVRGRGRRLRGQEGDLGGWDRDGGAGMAWVGLCSNRLIVRQGWGRI